jgi:hypothetical protein
MSSIQDVVQDIPRWDLLSKDKLYKRLKSIQRFTRKAFDEWWKDHKNPVHELYAKPHKKFKLARIAAPPKK